jgi:hypothetical protein
MLVGVSSDPSFGTPGTTYPWPLLAGPGVAEGGRDMRRVPPPDATVFGGHWATELRDGWVALTDTAARRGLAIVFPHDIFRAVWLWQVYGGWRGHYHLALEPWTGHPMQLDEAVASGAASRLEPGGTRTATVAFVVFDGRTSVTSVETVSGGFIVR